MATLAVTGASVDWIGTKGAAGCLHSSGTCGWQPLLLAPLLLLLASLTGTGGHLRVGGNVGGAGSILRSDSREALGVMQTTFVSSHGSSSIGRSGAGLCSTSFRMPSLSVAGAGGRVDWIGSNAAAGWRVSSSNCDFLSLLGASIKPVPREIQ